MSYHPNIYLDKPDALSSLLSRLELQAEIYVNGDFCGAWAMDTSGSRRIPFHLIGKGKAWLHVNGKEEQILSQGDLVIFPHDKQHILSNSNSKPPLELINAEAFGGDGPITQMICGFFDFQHKSALPLLDSLPDVIILGLAEQSANPMIRTLIELIVAELGKSEPGQYAVINQLAYLLFIQVIRQQISAGDLKTGLLTALFDFKISRALAAIHNKPSENWTLESLASEAAMGRSSFSQRFNELVGTPAMQYLTAWRMQEAKNLLLSTDKPIVEIAEYCGYESEAAFRKAYKKIVGEPPGSTRRK